MCKTENKIMVSANVWAPCRDRHHSLWKAETRHCHELLTIIFWRCQISKVLTTLIHLIHIYTCPNFQCVNNGLSFNIVPLPNSKTLSAVLTDNGWIDGCPEQWPNANYLELSFLTCGNFRLFKFWPAVANACTLKVKSNLRASAATALHAFYNTTAPTCMTD